MDTDQAPRRANPIGEYLRARRELITPEQAGLLPGARRRVPGLRREEVALLAGVSADYYMRLEQGRERNPSQQIVDALARALQLDEDGVRHLSRIARPTAGRSHRHRPERLPPALHRLLDTWADTPALVLGRTLDVLALNPLAGALYGGFTRVDNLVRMTFLDPAAHSFHRDWPRAARASVAALRHAAGRDQDHPGLAALVGELSLASPEFATLWADHDVRRKTAESKLFHHPQVGDLDLDYETFRVNSAPGLQLVVYQAEPGSPSADGLALLSSLAAHPVSEPSGTAHPR
ncbi:helix-turn-helix domain-containing protein [Kitasatospora sp. NPDC088346]|uniref:helix-turn-helix domain-containing protein n=1 Tax=Kitasatospora sp. NPDC088346 TaxID=3364073 RepID=UPI00380FFE91